MGILTDDMRRMVSAQQLGYVATVCPDGTPNLAPEGTIAAWEGDRLVFADIRSPSTIANLQHNPAIEVNVVDPIARKSYRFKGTAAVHADGALFDAALAFFQRDGVANPIQHVVVIEVAHALALTAPAYDLGVTEEKVRARWRRYYETLAREEGEIVTGE